MVRAFLTKTNNSIMEVGDTCSALHGGWYPGSHKCNVMPGTKLILIIPAGTPSGVASRGKKVIRSLYLAILNWPIIWRLFQILLCLQSCEIQILLSDVELSHVGQQRLCLQQCMRTRDKIQCNWIYLVTLKCWEKIQSMKHSEGA